jgi:hypothetical protein
MAKRKAEQEVPAEDGSQSIETLTQRYQQLNERKIEAKAHLDNAQRQLADLREQAREAYGTDDLDQLKKKLAEMKADNERKRAEYEAALNKIEADLAEVEKKHGLSEGAQA